MQPRLQVHRVAVLHLHGPTLLEEAKKLPGRILVLVCQRQRLRVRRSFQIFARVHVLKEHVVTIVAYGIGSIFPPDAEDAGTLELLVFSSNRPVFFAFDSSLRVCKD